MIKRLGIIGYPLGHSISPAFQQAALDHYSLDARYEAWEVETASLPEFMEQLRSPSTLGCNVTVPHKSAVMPYLDCIDEWARMAGAVNTIVNGGGKLSGHNTDGSGFLRALTEQANFTPEGQSVLIIGAGGAARGVSLSLARSSVASITIANRTLERAESLVRLLERHGPNVAAIPLRDSGEELAQAAGKSHLIVNCTTIGMKQGAAEETSPIPAEHIPARALVYDLVYNPSVTPLMREAGRAGAATLGGLLMLVYQGAASFELWTGREAPVEVMMKAAQDALASA